MALKLIDVHTQPGLGGLDQRIDDPAWRNPPQSHRHQGNNTDSYTGSPGRDPEHNREKAEKHTKHNDHNNRNQQNSNCRRFNHTSSNLRYNLKSIFLLRSFLDDHASAFDLNH
ncbi:hypothetical protein D3C75_886660 [compost metagenome]